MPFLDKYNNTIMKHVYSADDLANLVRDSVEYYSEMSDRAFETARKTREEVKAEVINEYAKENEEIKAKLKYAVVQLGSDLELERYKQFCHDHEKCLETCKANWGRTPYVRQTGTGIGVASVVVCQVCGAQQDITDFNNW